MFNDLKMFSCAWLSWANWNFFDAILLKYTNDSIRIYSWNITNLCLNLFDKIDISFENQLRLSLFFWFVFEFWYKFFRNENLSTRFREWFNENRHSQIKSSWNKMSRRMLLIVTIRRRFDEFCRIYELSSCAKDIWIKT